MNIDPLPWLEREWVFGLPAWLAPNIGERLRGTPTRLEAKLAGAALAITRRPASDKWSIQEHVGHLWDLEELWGIRFEQFKNHLPTLAAADVTNPGTWKAEHNQSPLADMLQGFRTARTGIVRFLDMMPAGYFQLRARHPRLGIDLTPVDLMYFIAEHDDHHLAQIARLMREASGPVQ